MNEDGYGDQNVRDLGDSDRGYMVRASALNGSAGLAVKVATAGAVGVLASSAHATGTATMPAVALPVTADSITTSITDVGATYFVAAAGLIIAFSLAWKLLYRGKRAV